MMLAALAVLSATPQTVDAVLQTSKPGDKIVLAAGRYGIIELPQKTWAPRPLFIDAQKAKITSIVARKLSGVVILGGSIVGPAPYGIWIRQSSSVVIQNMDISGALRGIVIGTAQNVAIRGNRLHGLRSDGIDVVGTNIVIDRNQIFDMNPIPGDHPDGIQLWSANGIQTKKIQITGNRIVGRMQGIFGRTPGIGLSDILVTDNYIRNGYPNGLVLLDVSDSTVTRNDVRWADAKLGKSNMRVVGDRNRVCGNLVPNVPSSIANRPC